MRRLLLVALMLAAPASVAAASKHVAIIIDTSGSMRASDRPRYTVQIAQIVSDLLEPGDQLTVVRLPQAETCQAGPDSSSSLAIRLDPGAREAFKRGLDRLIAYGGDNHFATPVRTAIQALSLDPGRPRMLLMLADSGGLAACDAVLTRELLQLRQSGAIVAAVNLGPSGGAFDTNPAFTFTTGALDAEQLTRAVAQVYQRFLGSRHVQTGQVGERIEVRIHPHVREAFLIVAADGPLGAIESDPRNPSAHAIDKNHRGGGQTRGLDGRTRGYRIVRLQRPVEGTWTFTVSELGGQTAGWLLLQDHALAARLVSSPTVGSGVASLLEVEVYDEETGQRVSDVSKLKGLEVTLEVDGVKIPLRDDGSGGDRQANDGILSASHTFEGSGAKSLVGHLRTEVVERTFKFDARVVDAGWKLRPMTAPRADAGTPFLLKVAVNPVGAGQTNARAPERIEARLPSGQRVTLKDTGDGGDERAGDRVYSATWTPTEVGALEVTYVPIGGGFMADTVKATVAVMGRIELGKAIPVVFGTLRGRSEGRGVVDLSAGRAHGPVEVELTSAMRISGTALEVQIGNVWQRLDRRVMVTVPDRGAPVWPLRLRVGDCPGAGRATDRHEVIVRGPAAGGKTSELVVPVSVEVIPDSWLHCWWPFLVAAAVAAGAGVVVHGYWVPSRFARGLGVQISDDPDLAQGFLHPIRAQKGTSGGFYRDARVYVCSDYRLRGRSVNALARLRARGGQAMIQPAGGAVFRQTADGEWDELPAHETSARPGTAYRNDAKTLFFELRTR